MKKIRIKIPMFVTLDTFSGGLDHGKEYGAELPEGFKESLVNAGKAEYVDDAADLSAMLGEDKPKPKARAKK